jgi:hypothetical protein
MGDVDASTPLGKGRKTSRVVRRHIMIMGSNHLEEFLRRSAGLDIDKSDMERLIALRARKLND